jgi:hypothetical protein
MIQELSQAAYNKQRREFDTTAADRATPEVSLLDPRGHVLSPFDTWLQVKMSFKMLRFDNYNQVVMDQVQNKAVTNYTNLAVSTRDTGYWYKILYENSTLSITLSHKNIY